MGKKVLYDGKEIELDDEIVNEISSEAIKRHQEENPDKTPELQEELKTAQTERDELKAKLEEAETEEEEEETDDTNKNITALRKKLEAKDKALEELQGKVDTTNKFVTSSITEKAIDKFAGDDEEMIKKINFHMANTLTAVNPTTEKELKAKVEQAAILSGWTDSKGDALNVAARTTGDTTPKSDTIDHDVAELGAKLGLTTEDWKNAKK